MLQARPPPREPSHDQYYDEQYEDAGYYPPPGARQPVGACLLYTGLVDLSLWEVNNDGYGDGVRLAHDMYLATA